MGAIYPDFKTNNASKLAASPAGLLYMLTALGLVFAVLALEAFPVYWLISTQITERPITDTQWYHRQCLSVTRLRAVYVCNLLPHQLRRA